MFLEAVSIIHFTLCLIFRRFWTRTIYIILYISYYIHIYIYIYVGKVYTGFSLLLSPLPHQIFIPPTKSQTSFLAGVIAPVYTIFVLISYSFETQIMLILILIDVQYQQNAIFSFEKFSIRQNHSSSGSHHLIKKSPHQCSLFLKQTSKILGEKEQ